MIRLETVSFQLLPRFCVCFYDTTAHQKANKQTEEIKAFVGRPPPELLCVRAEQGVYK